MNTYTPIGKIVIGGALLTAIALFLYVFGVGLVSLFGLNNRACTCPCDSAMVSPTQDTSEDWEVKGNEALAINNFDEAIKCYAKTGNTALVGAAKEKAVAYCYEQAATQTDLREQLAWLKKAKRYGGYPATNADIAELEQQIAAGNVKPIKSAPQKPAPATKPTHTQPAAPGSSSRATPAQSLGCEDVKIQITAGRKAVYRKGDRFTIVAKSGNNVCESGYWEYELGLWTTNKSANPVVVEVTSVPPSGTSTLRYMVGSRAQMAISIKISP